MKLYLRVLVYNEQKQYKRFIELVCSVYIFIKINFFFFVSPVCHLTGRVMIISVFVLSIQTALGKVCEIIEDIIAFLKYLSFQ